MHMFWQESTKYRSPLSLYHAQIGARHQGIQTPRTLSWQKILQEEERTSRKRDVTSISRASSDKMPPYSAMEWNVIRAAPVLTGPPDIPHEVQTRRLFAVISTTVVLGFAILSYGLRLWARKRSFQNLSIDDWLMGAGLLITLEPAICEYMCKEKWLSKMSCGADMRPIDSIK